MFRTNEPVKGIVHALYNSTANINHINPTREENNHLIAQQCVPRIQSVFNSPSLQPNVKYTLQLVDIPMVDIEILGVRI